jgi:glycosyltransferase involved in cell wall biosynthesis
VSMARHGVRNPRSVVQVTVWDSPYLGNFMSSQLVLADAVAAELGLATHLVLAEGARDQPWLAELDRPHLSWSILPPHGRARRRGHLERIAREHDAAIVHSHFTEADVEAVVAAGRCGARCIWQMHTGFAAYSARQRAKDLFKVGVLGRRVDRVIAVSDWVAGLARRRGFPAAKVVMLPNAIVLERFASLPARDAARARFALSPDADVVLALAWWPEAKGADVVLGALEQLAGRRAGIVGLLVGEERLEEFVRASVPDGVPWLRLTRFVDDATWLYAAADVFVSASRHEGYSYAVGEALTCSLPVVLSDIEGTRLFADAPGACTVPVGDTDALAGRLEQVLEDPRRDSMGAENRRWAARHLGIDRWCARMLELYRELL